MKKSKAIFWMSLWLMLLFVCALVLGAEQVVHAIQTGAGIKSPPFSFSGTVCQLVVCLGVLPFVLLPVLGNVCYHAAKEKRKSLMILAAILFFNHVLAVISFSLAAIDLI